LPHPLISPDISPSDSWFFRWNKEQMRAPKFEGADQIRSFLLSRSIASGSRNSSR
jgi:hypothetical protein